MCLLTCEGASPSILTIVLFSHSRLESRLVDEIIM